MDRLNSHFFFKVTVVDGVIVTKCARHLQKTKIWATKRKCKDCGLFIHKNKSGRCHSCNAKHQSQLNFGSHRRGRYPHTKKVAENFGIVV